MAGGIDSVANRAGKARLSDGQHWKELAGSVRPRCEMRVGTSARFCLECGTTPKRTERCLNCGSVLGPGVKYCYGCSQRSPLFSSYPGF